MSGVSTPSFPRMYNNKPPSALYRSGERFRTAAMPLWCSSDIEEDPCILGVILLYAAMLIVPTLFCAAVLCNDDYKPSDKQPWDAWTILGAIACFLTPLAFLIMACGETFIFAKWSISEIWHAKYLLDDSMRQWTMRM